jgi:coenzyme F420-reducing hydrogenase gamma subunit
VLIDGSVNASKRQDLINEFKEKEDVTVFLGNMQAAGVGINLVNSSDVIFCNFPFTPAELYQAEDRTHRIGQVNSVNIYYTVCDGSIDEHLYNIIASKSADTNALIDHGKEVVDFGNISELLFKKLIESYTKDHPEYHGKTEVEPAEGVSPGELHTDNTGKQEVLSSNGAYDTCTPPEL